MVPRRVVAERQLEGEAMKVAWALKQIPADLATPEMLYDVYRRHRLIPESVPLALSGFRNMAATGAVWEVVSDGAAVATVIVSGVIPGERADIELVPVSKFFRGGYEDDLRDAMRPVWGMVFEEHAVRRVTSCVPSSRRRTCKALAALGFRLEGRLRNAAKIVDREPEDLMLFGMIPEDLED